MNSTRRTPTPRTERLPSDVSCALEAVFERACRLAAGPLGARHSEVGLTGQWPWRRNSAGQADGVRALRRLPKSRREVRDRGAFDSLRREYWRNGGHSRISSRPPPVWPPPGQSAARAAGRVQGIGERRYLPISLRPSTTVTAPYSGATLSHWNAQAFAASSSVALMCVDLEGPGSGRADG